MLLISRRIMKYHKKTGRLFFLSLYIKRKFRQVYSNVTLSLLLEWPKYNKIKLILL